MPRKKDPRTPQYCRHRFSGNAYVRFDGQWFKLGKHGTPKSHAEYDRLVSEWLANGRTVRVVENEIDSRLTISEVIAAYWKYAQTYYVKDGHPTSEQATLKCALRLLRNMYARPVFCVHPRRPEEARALAAAAPWPRMPWQSRWRGRISCLPGCVKSGLTRRHRRPTPRDPCRETGAVRGSVPPGSTRESVRGSPYRQPHIRNDAGLSESRTGDNRRSNRGRTRTTGAAIQRCLAQHLAI